MKKTDHPPTGITPIKDKKSIIINDFMVCSLHKKVKINKFWRCLSKSAEHDRNAITENSKKIQLNLSWCQKSEATSRCLPQ